MSQKMTIITLDNSKINLLIVSETEKQNLINSFYGQQDNNLRKPWTSRTFKLSDGRVLIEFYDKQAALINNLADFDKLTGVRFIKTYIGFLKKNISYKIELTYDQGKKIVESQNPKKLDFKSEFPSGYFFEIYELQTGQILRIYESSISKFASVYENMKALASESDDVQNQYFGDMEKSSERFINGDPLLDYETDGQLVYPKDLGKIIQNHKLSLIDTKIHVNHFFGNLYRSEYGYYVLIDEINQKNGAGNKMPILTARVYETLDHVRKAQEKHEIAKNKKIRSEHFYKSISDDYGKDFPLYTKQLVDSLPSILNFDTEQLTFDSAGMEIVDEAILWNHSDHSLFDKWYPSVLAYYGECYIKEYKNAKWIVEKEKDYKVWTPHIVLL